jgi:adenosylcobinamide-phosphate synthase
LPARLRVRLIGPIRYGGQLVTEAFMGDADWPADLDGADLRRALRLVLVCDLLALAIGLTLIPLRVLML